MKNIVIIGAGFAGLTALLCLEKKYRNNSEIVITLIDRESYHLFYPNLYEVATSPEELTTNDCLRNSIVVPIVDIIGNKRITFIQGSVDRIDCHNQKVYIGPRSVAYDFLVQGLGATTNYYGIPGAERYSLALKSLPDAFRIRNKIEFLVQTHRQDITKDFIKIVIAGGGFLGVEIAAELKSYLDFLAWKNQYPRHKLQTVIIEGTSTILPGLDEDVVADVRVRLEQLSVAVQTNRFIAQVDDHMVEFKNGERLGFDCLIWAAGVKANSVPGPVVEVGPGGRARVGPLLCCSTPNIFFVGDGAFVLDTKNKPMPGTVPTAEAHGKYVAYAISELLQNRKPVSFIPKQSPGYFITVGGMWAVLKTPYFYINGILGYLARWLTYWYYFAGMLGWWRGFKISLLQLRTFNKN